MSRSLTILLLLALPLGLNGCRQPGNASASRGGFFNFNPTGGMATNSPATNPGDSLNLNVQPPTAVAGQVNNLQQQLGAYDVDNQQLYTEIAGLRQHLQLAQDYNEQLKLQLTDTAAQFQQMQRERISAEQQLQQLTQQVRSQQEQLASLNMARSGNGGVPAQQAGRATIRANNSLLQKLDTIQIPGGEVRMDGDVIRIAFPSDALFQPGTYQIASNQLPMVRNLVGTIQQEFPSQIIGIEAHWDGTPLQPATTTDHQLTATQALAVFNALAQLGLDPKQMFTMALGSNRPRKGSPVGGGVGTDRRIEVVIYPETF